LKLRPTDSHPWAFSLNFQPVSEDREKILSQALERTKHLIEEMNQQDVPELEEGRPKLRDVIDAARRLGEELEKALSRTGKRPD